MHLIDGKKISQNILRGIRDGIASHKTRPGLAVVLIGDDSASHLYVNLKEKASTEVGINFFKFIFDENISQKEVISKIGDLNQDRNVNGIIVQLPLPEKFDSQEIINAISPRKDVDGFHPLNLEEFFKDKSLLDPVFPRAIMKMIEHTLRESEKEAKNAVIVVNSDKFGSVMSKTLQKKGIESKIVFCEDMLNEEKKDSIKNDLLNAQIVISACGKPGLINASMIKDGAIIIDGGIKKEGKKVLGDVDINSFKDTDCFVTPVPGGVGPMTVACLLENVYLVSA
ncbi:MAG: bifunctional 5,10-methylenetetrahydrofolate dehydrogenase/5,10-methenyltetrahydrofolate cyclohydrolase [Candidatus Moranbacteria bacterium]|nr:bifunctional 5,10-methylenetetrahydrofolate dehydrogenase/5,10-methenyltetrahydrofolate cyclohydrolase [Candidatus Moranbacteria bacterium]